MQPVSTALEPRRDDRGDEGRQPRGAFAQHRGADTSIEAENVPKRPIISNAKQEVERPHHGRRHHDVRETLLSEHDVVQRRGEDEPGEHSSPSAPKAPADGKHSRDPGHRGEERRDSARELGHTTGRKRGEGNRPRKELRLVESFVRRAANLGHEPVATLDHVAREQDPARVVRLPDRRTPDRNRQHDDRKREHQKYDACTRPEITHTAGYRRQRRARMKRPSGLPHNFVMVLSL